MFMFFRIINNNDKRSAVNIKFINSKEIKKIRYNAYYGKLL